MNGRTFSMFLALLLLALNANGQTGKPAQRATVKLIYSSDLYFPPDDPDDYFDLATLMTTPEIDVLGIVLDQQLYDRRPESEGTGAIALRQMFEITGRAVPYTIGLRHPLRSIDDQCLNQDPLCQKGVEMILALLEKTDEKVMILTVGTVRDVAAAWNRNPGLFREKVSRLYVNTGIYGFPQGRFDVNLEKDRNAFLAVMKSGLPVYWAACFGDNNYETYWQADQRRILETAAPKLQNYFLYAFSKGTGTIGPAAGKAVLDPMEFLRRPLEKEEVAGMYSMTRNMWSTVSFLDAAGMNIYRNERGEYTALRQPVGDFTRAVKPYSFKRVKVFIDDKGRVHPDRPGNIEVFVIHKEDADEYRNALESILRKRFGR
ncbi:MAG: hypothetical protein HYZ01_07375 [Ignavibacteriales bacterium]|nr:hypothetical protein [Ignavibacteriales bacterium]